MPILVYVIQPEHTFLCKDEGDEELLNIAPELNSISREGGFIRFKLEGGQATLINAANIGMVRYISEEDVEESKKLAENQRREKAQSDIIRPTFRFPNKKRPM